MRRRHLKIFFIFACVVVIVIYYLMLMITLTLKESQLLKLGSNLWQNENLQIEIMLPKQQQRQHQGREHRQNQGQHQHLREMKMEVKDEVHAVKMSQKLNFINNDIIKKIAIMSDKLNRYKSKYHMLAADPSTFSIKQELWNSSFYECVGWIKTEDCNPYAKSMNMEISPCNYVRNNKESGFCEIRHIPSGKLHKVMLSSCFTTSEFSCEFAMNFTNFRYLAAQFQNFIDQLQTTSLNFQPIITLATNSQPINDIKKQTTDQEVNFQLIEDVLNFVGSSYGIVIASSAKTLINAFILIKILREVHKSDLPVELWCYDNEIHQSNKLLKNLLANFNVKLRTLPIKNKLKGFFIKIYAILYSQFQHVLLLDADNLPVRDPEYLFYTKEYIENGAVFWPDYWTPNHSIFNVNVHSLLWELIGSPFRVEFEQESGQILINKERCKKALMLLYFYASNFALFKELGLIWGDKDLYRLAFSRSSMTYHMIQYPPGSLGFLVDGIFCGVSMVQYDPYGDIIFFHRNTVKFSDEEGQKKWWSHYQYFTGTNLETYHIEYLALKSFPSCFGATSFGNDSFFAVQEMKSTNYFHLEDIALNIFKEVNEFAIINNTQIN